MTNYQPTAEELRWLASFAGVDISWCDILTHGEPLHYFARWNPLEDWNHLRLVLEALVNQYYLQIDIELGGECHVHVCSVASVHADTLPEAVCKAALEVMGDEG